MVKVLHVSDSMDADGYKGGDVLCAFDDTVIQCGHARHIYPSCL